MAGRILILDSVATNRIILKVKMSAAQYDVHACATQKEALNLIRTHHPDLLLVNMSDPVENRYDFCRTLRDAPETASLGIICVGIADTSRARFAAIDCGADDVLPRPISDTLMMARIRSLIRQRNLGHEWELRDGVRAALGFEEHSAPRLTPTKAVILSHQNDMPDAIRDRIGRAMRRRVPNLVPNAVGRSERLPSEADLLFVDGTDLCSDPSALYQTIAELQTSPQTKNAAKIAIVPPECDAMAAMSLDLGADDVVFETIGADELRLRISSLMTRKAKRDQLNDNVRDGLNAAITDPLTGLHNRRYADRHLANVAHSALKTGRNYAVMLVDADHFKSINDKYGHDAGDAVLTALAERMRSNLRSIDLIARIGGEEFLVVMPDTSPELARLAADRLRRLVNGANFSLGADRKSIPVTVSVGVAVQNPQGLAAVDTKSLVRRADQALYKAKSAGRNMVSMSRTAA